MIGIVEVPMIFPNGLPLSGHEKQVISQLPAVVYGVFLTYSVSDAHIHDAAVYAPSFSLTITDLKDLLQRTMVVYMYGAAPCDELDALLLELSKAVNWLKCQVIDGVQNADLWFDAVNKLYFQLSMNRQQVPTTVCACCSKPMISFGLIEPEMGI